MNRTPLPPEAHALTAAQDAERRAWAAYQEAQRAFEAEGLPFGNPTWARYEETIKGLCAAYQEHDVARARWTTVFEARKAERR